jgi:hypothetical protein
MSMQAPSSRQTKILSRFPSFMRPDAPEKSLGEIAGALGYDLDEAERLMTRIQRAHRLTLAEEERDIFQLAALVGLQRADLLILRRFYEKGFFASEEKTAEKAYGKYLSELKESVQRIVRIMLQGCGTIWALLEGASVLINADTIGEIKHTDAAEARGGFIHRVPVEYNVIEDQKQVLKRAFIYLVENPLVDRATEDKERQQREHFNTKRMGFFNEAVAVQITGVADRTVWPMVINQDTHEGVGFGGSLTDGQRVVFAADGKAYLDGSEVTDRCYYIRGALFGHSSFNSEARRDLFCIVKPAGSLDRNYPRPTITPLAELPVPILRLGDSTWRFSVEEGAFDASGFDQAVFASGNSTETSPPMGKVQLLWREHEPFSVAVLIPADLKSLEAAMLDGQDLRELVRAGLERFRAAGIKLTVDYFNDKWIMGASILKTLGNTSGVGVDFDGTVTEGVQPG